MISSRAPVRCTHGALMYHKKSKLLVKSHKESLRSFCAIDALESTRALSLHSSNKEARRLPLASTRIYAHAHAPPPRSCGQRPRVVFYPSTAIVIHLGLDGGGF